MTNLDSYLRRKGAYSVDMVSPDCIPGCLLKVHYFWRPGDFFGPESVLLGQMGSIAGLPSIPKLTTESVPSNFLIDNVTDQFSIAAGVGLPQFGLTASGSLTTSTTVTWNISGIKTTIYDPESLNELNTSVFPSLSSLSKTSAYRWLQECFLVRQAYFVSALSATVHTADQITGSAAFQQAGITATGNMRLDWSSENAFTLTGDATVPFAVAGNGVS
jgi:hypothetical protein